MSRILSRDEVLRIAELARLALTDDEIDLLARQLGGILDYVEQIRGLDTADVPPTSHVLLAPVERADDAHATLDRRAALGNAPDAALESGLFKVPRVFG